MSENANPPTEQPARHGMLLGKFLPPHLGHVYLVDFARHYVRNLTVVVGSLKREPIPGELRYRWMRELFPDVNVVHLTDELPQDPSEHPDFWRLWHSSLTRILPERPDFVFASEHYGWKLAEVLGARFVPVDRARGIVPVSGTAVRTDPMANWQYIPRCARPYFVRRVCVFGPESTGKSTLAKRLAEQFKTAVVPEYARTWIEARDGKICADDIPIIARGQMASEDACALNANRVLICDTDILLTTIWSDWLFKSCPDWIRSEAARRSYDVTLLLDVDVPWIDDIVRFLPGERRTFHERCENVLNANGRTFVRISGSWDERFQQAVRAVETMLTTSKKP